MGINFAPKTRDLPPWQGDSASSEDELNMFAFPEAYPVNEARLASGWWILPFAAAGLIECYFAIDWIFDHL